MSEPVVITGRQSPTGVHLLTEDQAHALILWTRDQYLEARTRSEEEVLEQAAGLMKRILEWTDPRTGLCPYSVPEMAQRAHLTQKETWEAVRYLLRWRVVREVSFPAAHVPGSRLYAPIALDSTRLKAVQRMIRQSPWLARKAQSQTT